MSQVKIGVVGCGRIAGLVHLPILSRLKNVELTALADPDASALAAAARFAPRATRFRDVEELAESDVDAVVVCTPSGTHAAAALAVLRRRKHLYLEKPLAASSEDAAAILAVWHAASVVGMIGYNLRRHPLVVEARRLLHSGRVGAAEMIRTVFCRGAGSLRPWKTDRGQGGGAPLDLATHDIDLVRYLLDEEVVEVSALFRSLESDDDSAVLQMRTSGGVSAQVFVSCASAADARLEVYGRRGRIAFDRYRSLAVEVTGSSVEGRLIRTWRRIQAVRCLPYLFEKLRSPVGDPSYKASLTRFVEAIRDGRSVGPDLSDGFQSLAVVLAAEESVRTGRSVVPPSYSRLRLSAKPRAA